MSSTSAAQDVQRFFAYVGVAGLKLPNGWFGRPFDNLHQCTSARVVEGALVVELDGQLTLTLVGPIATMVEGSILRLTGFTSADWNWTEYGSSNSHHERFEGGTIEFIGPPS